MKKFIASLAIFALIATAFVGCSKTDTTETGDTTPVSIVYLVSKVKNGCATVYSSDIYSEAENVAKNRGIYTLYEVDGAPYEVCSGEVTAEDIKERSGYSATMQQKIIEETSYELSSAVEEMIPKTAEADILKGLDLASRKLKSSTANENGKLKIVVVASGFQTTGSVKMQDVNALADVESSVTKLKDSSLIPNLENVEVSWFGLGDSSGDQQSATGTAKTNLQAFWNCIITSGGGSVDFETDPGTAIDKSEMQSWPDVSIVPVTQYELDGSSYNEETVFVMDETTVAFKPDSVEFVDEDSSTAEIEKIANYMQSNSSYELLLCGTTATVPPNDQCVKFSKKRAEAVKKVLTDKFKIKSTRITTIGLGFKNSFHINDVNSDGSPDESKAPKNRAVIAMNLNSETAQQIQKGA